MEAADAYVYAYAYYTLYTTIADFEPLLQKGLQLNRAWNKI